MVDSLTSHPPGKHTSILVWSISPHLTPFLMYMMIHEGRHTYLYGGLALCQSSSHLERDTSGSLMRDRNMSCLSDSEIN